MRYLKGTLDKGTVFESSPTDICGFADASYANDDIDGKSVGGFTFKLVNTSISWESNKTKRHEGGRICLAYPFFNTFQILVRAIISIFVTTFREENAF